MRAFAALASARNFTRAAEECHLTQSAFSALIANLEDGLGLKLFARNTRNVDLTSEGEAFLNIVKSLLPETERALEMMRDQAVLKRGKVAIAALPTICSSILPALIETFHAAHPDIELIIEDVDQFQNDLDRTRGIFQRFAMIPALKAAVAHWANDAEWRRVRPPLVELTHEQEAELISSLKETGFSMPGLV